MGKGEKFGPEYTPELCFFPRKNRTALYGPAAEMQKRLCLYGLIHSVRGAVSVYFPRSSAAIRFSSIT